MKPFTRRMFLGGSGIALAIPMLPSLLPRQARAGLSASPVRYIQVLNPYGPTTSLFFGEHATDQQNEPHLNVKALADNKGDNSTIV